MNQNDQFTDAAAKSMMDVFLQHRLVTIINWIIKEKYYYSNPTEIERILELTRWIIEGDDEDSKHIRGSITVKEFFYESFLKALRETNVIHYDSLMKFRIKSYEAYLQTYVGLAIDEFKQEEDHQAFIEMLRSYIKEQNALFDEVHILQANNFMFYKKTGRLFTQLELQNIKREKPLYVFGLDINEWNLSPLIAMAPEKIYIYGDDPSEAKTLTIINIFEEKVIFKPYHHFPFMYQLKSHK